MTPRNRRETTTQDLEAIRIDEEGGQDVKVNTTLISPNQGKIVARDERER